MDYSDPIINWIRLIINDRAVFRIQLILMRIRIRDPNWKKMDPDPHPDPGYFFKIY